MPICSLLLLLQPRLQQSINKHNFPEFVEVSDGARGSHTRTAGMKTEAHSWEGKGDGCQLNTANTTSGKTGREARKHAARRLRGFNPPLM